MVFSGELNGNELTNGVVDYKDENYSTKIDLCNKKIVGKQYIQYNEYNYYGKPENIKVLLQWKRKLNENGNILNWLFLPKIVSIEGYFKVSRIEEKFPTDEY